MIRRVPWLAGVLVLAWQGAPHGDSPTSRPTARIADAREWTGTRPPPPADTAPAQLLSHKEPGRAKSIWVLHIGDSFVDAAFQQNLRPRFRTAGTVYVSSGATSTYTTTWAYDPKLDGWLSNRPALVIITLGANEAEVPLPAAHAKAIERLVHKIAAAGAACVWTTPPMWKADTGILRVIYEHSAPCVFFDSDAVLGGLSPAERQGDRIHPNRRGGARWADAFWLWLIDHRNLAGGPWSLVPFERRDG